MRSRRAALLAMALEGLVAAALAHDFWIEPSSFHPGVPSQVEISLRVGQNFQGDPVPRMNTRIVEFVLASGRGETPVAGLPGTDPAGFLKIEEPGLYVVGYRSSRIPIILEADKFEKYLAEEGLESVIAERARRGESRKPGSEVYSRCAKSLIAAAERGRSGFDRTLGFPLELVPMKSPAGMLEASDLPVKLLYAGRALPNVLVVAINRQEPGRKLIAHSDENGLVLFHLPKRGVWLVKSVHMVAAPKETGADWESLWASLTFEIP